MEEKIEKPRKAESTLTELTEQLKSNNLRKRLQAIDSLKEIGGKEVVSLLVKTLSDDSWHVRSYAAQALGGLGYLAIPSLLEALSGGVWYVRAAASIALGELGEIEAVDPLLRLIDDENRTVRKEATAAISRIVRKNPELFLRQYLEKRDEDFTRMFLERLRSLDEEAYHLIVPKEEEF